MNPNQGREAAYVKSRVKDLSLITNAPDYVGLFACITPKANAELENEENITFMINGSPTDDRSPANRVYLPQLVRDVDTLTNLFGDPRVDPDTYKDLLAVRYIVQNGFACYIAKVRSGEPYTSTVTTEGFFNNTESACQYNIQLDEEDYAQVKADLSEIILFNTQSSVIGKNTLVVRLIPYKPYSINQVSLEIKFTSKATDLSEEVNIVTTRVILTPDTRNADLLKTINSYLGGDLIFQLPDYMDDSLYATPYDAYASIESDIGKYFCIANVLLYLAGVYKMNDPTGYLIADNMTLVGLTDKTVDDRWLSYYRDSKGEMTFSCGIKDPSDSKLNVTQADYINSLQTFNDPKYSGCFISELSSDITHESIVEKTRYLPKEYTTTYSGGSDSSEEESDEQKKNTFVNTNEFSYIKSVKSSTEEVVIESEEDPDNPSSDPDEPTTITVDRYDVSFTQSKPSYEGVCSRVKSGDTYTYEVEDKNADLNNVWCVDAPTNDSDPDYTTAQKVENPSETEPESGKIYFLCLDPDINSIPEDVENNIPQVYFRAHGDTRPVINPDTQARTYYGEDGNIKIILDTTASSSDDPNDGSSTVISQYTRIYPVLSDPVSVSDFIRASSSTRPTYYVEEDVESTSGETSTTIVPVVDGDPDSLHQRTVNSLVEMKGDDRRGLHYIIKQLAAVRKNLTCIFTTPYCPLKDDDTYSDDNVYDLTKACNWVAARGEFADLFEYGNSQAVDYSEQAFYCEMYWSWLKWRVAKLVNGLATGSSAVIVPASSFVILNSLASYRTKGAFYPVAGDQGGILPDSCTVLQNPSTKSQRDKLISYRINPIYDTGIRGVQIYGNETLNPQYTDLSAAHIARTLVQIRSRVDAYSETIKFRLNDVYTWSEWINYVTTKILNPIKSLGGLQWFQVDMGYQTTTRDEIAQRKIRGMISLQFTPDLEIIDLEFVIMASSLELGTE